MSESPSAPAAGEPADQLFETVYARIKRMAHRQLAGAARRTLDTTELVHELFLRMGRDPELRFAGDAQFFAYAARAMRHVLMDRARDCMRLRAGGDWARVTLDAEDQRLAIEHAEQALAIDEALQKLSQADGRAAKVLELRYFAGLSVDQTAELLGLSPRSVDRDWRFARAFLHDLLADA